LNSSIVDLVDINQIALKSMESIVIDGLAVDSIDPACRAYNTTAELPEGHYCVYSRLKNTQFGLVRGIDGVIESELGEIGGGVGIASSFPLTILIILRHFP
jgi:hypothetical protein